MKDGPVLIHEFVEYIPGELMEGTIYVSIPFATAAHKCVCGCGNEVVTPITPTDWQLGFDGNSISLHPSIGNWNLPCRSHYWIRQNKVTWARRWSQQELESGKAHDRLLKERYFDSDDTRTMNEETPAGRLSNVGSTESLWQKLRKLFS